MSILEYGKQVLRVEAEAVASQVERCGPTFEAAVKAILALDERGRFVISGMGKAGLVGEKISATLASTGTPSIFLHPAEAIHGDLGRVTPHDLVLVMSNSGESSEIVRLVEVLKKIGVRGIIAMTGKAASSMAKHSDIVLDIGNLTEACPLGLAPSATTTAMLALGDALALTVQKERGFSPEDYARYHPGGALGRKLMKVSEAMRTGERNVLVEGTALVKDVLILKTKVRAGAAVVIHGDGTLHGLFTDGDLRRHLAQDANILNRAVSEVMAVNPLSIQEDKLLTEAARIMRERQFDEIPVVDAAGKAVGLLDIQDLLSTGVL